MNTTIENIAARTKEYHRRYDFYWQSLSMYAIALLLYSLLRGTVVDGNFSLVLYDPVVILLAIFVFGTGITLLVKLYKRASIIVGPDYLLFRTSYREQTYHARDIEKMSLRRERLMRFGGRRRLVRIRIAGRRRIIRIRPLSFWGAADLMHDLAEFKKRNNI
ncbi:MAG: hypothetical protein ACLFQX_00295 [Candidatus Kapaibacterium sp.]